MPDANWEIEKLQKRHDRAAFCCGVEVMDDYLRRFAGQNEKAGISQHFVAVEAKGASRVLGYYALSAGAVAFEHITDDLKKRLPRYPVPVAHLGRLAVDQSMRGKGLGAYLLIDALARVVRIADQIGIHAVEAVALDDNARQFYLKFGFVSLVDDKRHLYLPLTTIRKLGLV